MGLPALLNPCSEPGPYRILIGLILPIAHDTFTNVLVELLVFMSQTNLGMFTSFPLGVTKAELM